MTVLTTIITVLVVLLVLYLIVNWMSQTNTTLNSGVTSAGSTGGRQSGASKAPMPKRQYKLKGDVNSSNYTFSIWYYVTSWNPQSEDTKRPPLISSESGFKITMAGAINDLHITIPENPVGTPGTPCTISNVPLQRWTNVIVSVYGRTVDVYLDGKLVKTCILQRPAKGAGPMGYVSPHSGDNSASENAAIVGYTANGQFWDSASSPQQAYNIYKNGFGGGVGDILDKYRLKIAFMDNNKEMVGLEI